MPNTAQGAPAPSLAHDLGLLVSLNRYRLLRRVFGPVLSLRLSARRAA